MFVPRYSLNKQNSCQVGLVVIVSLWHLCLLQPKHFRVRTTRGRVFCGLLHPRCHGSEVLPVNKGLKSYYILLPSPLPPESTFNFNNMAFSLLFRLYMASAFIYLFLRSILALENDSPTRRHYCTDFQKGGNTPDLMDCKTWIRKILLNISGTEDTGVLSKMINLTQSLWTQTSLTKLHFIPHWIHKSTVHIVSYGAGCPDPVDGALGWGKMLFSLFWIQSQETLNWMTVLYLRCSYRVWVWFVKMVDGHVIYCANQDDFKVKEGTIKNYPRTRGIKQDSSGLIRTDVCVGTGVNNGRACVGPSQSGLLLFVTINTACVTLDKSFFHVEPQFPKQKRY